jgi:hypothetical protein
VTGIEAVITGGIKVYPNPASDIISVELDSQTTIEWINIYDYSGRIVQSEFVSGMLNSQKFSLPIKDLSSGMYFMTLKTDRGISAVRFNVQH